MRRVESEKIKSKSEAIAIHTLSNRVTVIIKNLRIIIVFCFVSGCKDRDYMLKCTLLNGMMNEKQ